jgi:uncharacterized membrane protein SpoIIM required for sporulation
VQPADALRVGFRLPVVRGRSVLPFYLFGGGVGAAARLPLVVGLVVAYLLLTAQERIAPVARELGRIDPGAFEPTTGPAVPPGLDDALAGLFTPNVVLVLGLSLLGSVLVAVPLGAAARAATTATVYAGVRGDDAATAGVGGMADHWPGFLALLLLRVAATVLALLPVALALAVAGTAVGAGVGGGSPTLAGAAVLIGLLGGLFSLVLLLAVTLLFAFAGPAIVVDDVGAWRGVRNGVGFLRRRPGAALVYVVVVLGTLFAFAALAGLAGVAGVSRLAALLGTVFVFPALDGVKVGLYADADPAVGGSPPRVRAGLGRGLRAFVGFARGHPLENLLAIVLLAVAIAAGYAATAPYGARIDPPTDVLTVFGAVPIGPFVNIAANNWLVATTFAYGGLAVGAGAASGLAFNGLLVGALAGVFDRVAFLALVAPHGLLELPVLAAAGGLGFHLGRVGWGWVRGRRSRPEVAAELVDAFDVLVGIAVLLVVASFVEAVLTPRIAAYVLGG